VIASPSHSASRRNAAADYLAFAEGAVRAGPVRNERFAKRNQQPREPASVHRCKRGAEQTAGVMPRRCER
jgi:hypothetical protein